MRSKITAYSIIFSTFFFVGCKDKPAPKTTSVQKKEIVKDSVKKDSVLPPKKEEFRLTEKNAIDFFFNYNKTLTKNKVRITTNLGSFTIKLYDNVPYHKSNFIYLTRKGYFDNSYFHRVVKNFIIQGGNADTKEIRKKRREIGRYLLPPDTRKGYKHHRGTVSMPSSEIDNPFKLASPFEFFIVVTRPGSYHLDKDYTPFGKVIQGMDVVDKINRQPVDSGDWPKDNIYITKAEVIE